MSETLEATAEEREASLAARAAQAAAAANFAEAVASGQVAPAEPTGRVAFVAPVEANTKYIVKAGKPLAFPDKDSPRGQKMVEREGDIVVQFHDGLLVLDPAEEGFEEQLAWCEAHPEVCRNVSDPMAEVWFNMKQAQLDMSNREATMPKGVDIEAALRGDPRGYSTPGSITDRARKHLEASA